MPSEPLVDATAMAMIPLCMQMVSLDSQLSLHLHYKAFLMKSRQKESPQGRHLHKAVSRPPRKLGIFFFTFFILVPYVKLAYKNHLKYKIFPDTLCQCSIAGLK